MDEHSIGLFIHVVGALGLFVALGLEWTGLGQIRSATLSEQVRAWMGIFKSARRVGFVSMLTTVITGIYMVLRAWGGAAWVFVSLAALALIIVLSLTLTGPRMAAIGMALKSGKTPVLQTVHNLAGHPLLWISIQTRIAIVLGIVFLKVAKPDWSGSLLIIGVAIVLGIASALPASRRELAQERSPD